MASAVASQSARTTSDARGGTRDKILRAAERLFAREGFDRVTLRQIARAAGQRNVAAVQYHFGSKDGLLAAIVDVHRADLDERRRALLEAREAARPADEPATLLRILIDPLVEKLDSPSGRAYLRIQAQGFSNETMRPATRTVVQRIGHSLGTAEGAPRSPHRNHFGVLLLFHALADRARQEEKGAASRADRAEFKAALEDALLGLFRGGRNA